MSDYAQQLNQYDDDELRAGGVKEETIAKLRAKKTVPVESTQAAPIEQPEAEVQPLAEPIVDQPQPVEAQPISAPVASQQAEMETDEQKRQRVIDKMKVSRVPIPDEATLTQIVASEPYQPRPLTAQEKKAKYQSQTGTTTAGPGSVETAAERKERLAKEAGLSKDEFNEFNQTVAPAPEADPMMDVPASKEEQDAYDSNYKKLAEMYRVSKSAENETQKYFNMYKKQLEDFRQQKADPNSVWQQPDEAKKAFIAMAMEMGGWWGRHRSDNPGLMLIKAAIEQEAALRNQNREDEYKRLQATGNLFEMSSKLNKEGPSNIRGLGDRINVLNSLIAQGERLAAKPRANQQKAKQMLSQLEAWRDADAMQVEDLIRSGKATYPESAITKDTPDAFVDEKARERRVPGYDGLATSPKDKERFQGARIPLETGIQTVDRILDAVRNGSKLSPSKREIVRLELVTLIGKVREPWLGPGTMDKNEYERVKDAIGDPNKLWKPETWSTGTLSRVKENLQNDLNMQARAAGLRVPKKLNSLKERE
jgi:hypothetical protein